MTATRKNRIKAKSFLTLFAICCLLLVGMLFAGCDLKVTGVYVTYSQGSQVIYASENASSLDLSKIKVYEVYENGKIGTEELTITHANLSLQNNALTFAGSNMVTVTYNEYITEFQVIVTQVTQNGINARYVSSQTIYAGDTLSDFNIDDVIVKVQYNDGSLGNVLTGLNLVNFSFVTGSSFVAGTNSIKVSADGYETTFTVSAVALVATSIMAEWNSDDKTAPTLYNTTENTVQDLKSFVNVYWVNNNGDISTRLEESEYTLSMTTGVSLQTAGNKVITITANNHATFTPATLSFYVTQARQTGITATYTQGDNQIYTNDEASEITVGTLRLFAVWNDVVNNASHQNVEITDISGATYSFPDGVESFSSGNNNKVVVTLNTFSCEVTGIIVDLFYASSIDIDFEQGAVIIYETTNMEDIIDMLTVTVTFTDGTTSTTESYTLPDFVTEFVVGTNVEISIVLTNYNTLEDSFIIPRVYLAEHSGIEATWTQGDSVYYTSDTLNGIESDILESLSLEYIWNDGRTNEVILDNTGVTFAYAEGATSFSAGENTVTVNFDEFTTTITINITAVAPVSIAVTKTGSFPTTIYTSTSLTTESIKNSLSVVITQNDGNTVTLANTAYVVTFTEGTDFTTAGSKTITINPNEASYDELTGDYTVTFTVIEVAVTGIKAVCNVPANTTLYTSTDVTQWLTVNLVYNDDLTGVEGRTYDVTEDCTITYTNEGSEYTTLQAGNEVGMKVVYTDIETTQIYTVSIPLGTVSVVAQSGISATSTQTVFDELVLEDLKTYLTVKVLNNDGTTGAEIASADYVLSVTGGTLVTGLNTITITSGTWTTTIEITILDVSLQATCFQATGENSYSTGFSLTRSASVSESYSITTTEETAPAGDSTLSYWVSQELSTESDMFLICIKMDGFEALSGNISIDITPNTTAAAKGVVNSGTAVYWTIVLDSVLGGGTFIISVDVDGNESTTYDDITFTFVLSALEG